MNIILNIKSENLQALVDLANEHLYQKEYKFFTDEVRKARRQYEQFNKFTNKKV